MLKELSKKDKKWRSVAYVICEDKDLADDLVQEMYLKLHNCNKEINDYYVISTLRNLFLSQKRLIKNKKTVRLEHLPVTRPKDFEPNDYETHILEEFNKLKWLERELIEESYYKSYREIASELKGVGYNFVYNKTIGAIKKILKEDFDLHKNSNLKRNGKN